MNFIKKFPLAMSGLFLASLTLGNLLTVFNFNLRIGIGILVFIFYICYLLKLLIYPDVVNEELNNPLVASSFPTIAMATIVLSSYAKDINNFLAVVMWYGGIIFYFFYIPFFTRKFVSNFNIKQVFATWYIVYVGVAIAGILTPVSGNYILGYGTFLFGLVMFMLSLPIIGYRTLKYRDLNAIQFPSHVVLAAPASLLFLSYFNSVQNKNEVMLLTLFAISQLFYVICVPIVIKVLVGNFYPTLSATTFPMVTGAFVTKLLASYFQGNVILVTIYWIQFIFAIIVVTTVFLRYLVYFNKQKLV